MCTGPGRPLHISRKAMRSTSGMRPHSNTGPPHLTAGRNSSSWSWPWNVAGEDG